MKVKEIIIESEAKGPILGGHKETNDNSEIDVVLEDGRTYSATAFTYENIEWLKNKNRSTGECLNGRYFWASNMFIVSKINRNEIVEVVNHLIQKKEFESVFKRKDYLNKNNLA